MNMQKTLKSPVTVSGVGLHTGEFVKLTINPASENHGLVFKRTDIKEQPTIDANADFVVGTERGTTIEQNGARVYTTEHVLASLYGLEIDNALIELDGPEIPIMEGSSKLFRTKNKSEIRRPPKAGRNISRTRCRVQNYCNGRL
jgi:UDP-3-O-[3-hydroxymyristoyl] N-acetylglucosamine deacetylase / 3-hydroxyacyl-[acyl-carrier-protein] dehydratase